MFTPLRDLPAVSSDPSALAHLQPGVPIGIDFEWNPRTMEPSLVGLSDGVTRVSVPFKAAVGALPAICERASALVGHNLVSAEVPILERDLGLRIPNTKIEDTILRWWLTNMHLCKSTGKSESDDPKEARGFMNLWTMLSMTTNAWCYKACRGTSCVGPCPDHQPFWYNGLDAYYPLEALPVLRRWSSLRGVEHLVPFHVQLARVLNRMREYGVAVDREYVRKLRREFQRDKLAIYDPDKESGILASKFNPRSVKQVQEYFAAREITLEDNTEETIREATEEFPEDEDLALLLEYKELGDGPDRWFAPRHWNTSAGEWEGFVEPDSRIRPRLNFFTSSGRFACTNPNLQNVQKRRIDRQTGEKVGKRFRRAIVASEGHYLIKGDLSNAENRVMLYHGGYTLPADADVHAANVAAMGIQPEDEFALHLGGPRDAAKSVGHSSNYAEGLQLLPRSELNKSRVVNEVAAGARLVYPDWTFEDKVVTFTGVNLARRAYGKATWENRKRALDFAARYFAAYPGLRIAQRRIMKQVETELAVRPPHGYYLSSFGYAEDRLKTALAVWGSQPIAHLTKLALLRAADDGRIQPVLQIHDELLFEVPLEVDERTAAGWVRDYMEIEMEEMPGLVIPVDIAAGPNWADTHDLRKRGRFLWD